MEPEIPLVKKTDPKLCLYKRDDIIMRNINWAVLGTASIAKEETIPAMLLSRTTNLYAIAGRSKEKVEEFQSTFGFETTYLDYDECLADPLVDAVYIPLPNHIHKEYIIKAARAKKHILCEKPLAASAEDVLEIINVCKTEGVHFMEAFAFLHCPIVDDLINRVKSGVIGDIRLIETLFYIPSFYLNGDIRGQRETLGGGQYDLGCYNIALILKLMDKMPIDIDALGKFTEAGIDRYCHSLLEFDDGTIATSSSGMILERTENYRMDECYIKGEKGQIEMKFPYNASGLLSYDIIKAGKTQTIEMRVPNNYFLEIEQFNRCILGEETPLVSNEFSYKVAQVQDKILEKIGYWQK